MERFEFMAAAEKRRRELTYYDIEDKKRKKSGGKASKQTSKKASADSASPAKASKGTKSGSTASKQRMKNQTNPNKKRNTIEENPLARRNSQVYYVAEERRAPAPGRPRRAEYDPYDYPKQPPRRRNASGGKKRRKRRKKAFGFDSFLLLLLIIGFGCLCAWRVQEYEAFAEMKKAVSRQTFYQGTTVEGVDVSGMTLQQAVDYWDQQIEPRYRQTAVVLNDGTRITSDQMGYSSNYMDILGGAWNAGRSGSLEERYRRMEQYIAQPKAYEVSRSLFDDALVRSYVLQLAGQIDTLPRDASLKAFNKETYAFEFEAEEFGRSLNQSALISSIEHAFSAGGGSVQMDVQTIAPNVTLENVSSQYGMISSSVTNAESSSQNRLSNIRLSLETIDGIALEPGQSFSFNEIVGKRTTERGYKTATAYSSGKVTEEVGGGICQVSTTLFNAAVKADLKIDERHPHSLTVSYVDMGKDAAVDWGNKDLKFTNTSDDRVYICCTLTEDKRVRIGIFGKLLPDGITVTLEGEKTKSHDFETQYQMSFELAAGQTRVIQKGKKGYSAVAYKIWWDANGNELRRSELCKSNYQSTPEIVEYGAG